MNDAAISTIAIGNVWTFAPLLAAVAAFFILTWKDPKQLLWAFIVAQPLIGGFYYTNIAVFSIVFKLPIFINNLFITAFVLFMFRKFVLEKERIVLPGGAFLWYLLFLLAAGASVFTTEHVSLTVSSFAKLAFWFLILLVVVNLALAREEIIKAFFTMLAVSFLPLAVGLFQLTRLSRLEVPHRINSLYVHPNVFAYYLVLLIAAGWFFLPVFTGWKKRLVVSSLALSLICLAFTFTRGAWICLVLSFGMTFLLFGIKVSHLKKLSLGLAGILALAVLAAPLREKIVSLIQEPRVAGSLQWRWIHWRETAGDLISSLPNLYSGRGVGTFHFYGHFPGFAAHNDYLMIWSGAGLAAAVVLIIFHLKWLLDTANGILTAGTEQGRAAGKVLFAAVVTAAVGLFTENLLLLPLFQTHLWLIGGLAVRNFRLERNIS
ncbi:MAG: hypothetical protein SCM96_09600 [Acidobacteriota bacterium]|nr:hypothetical protein [Acidobacteriota bacterium]